MLKVEKFCFPQGTQKLTVKCQNIFPENTRKSNITQLELARFRNIHEYTCIYIYMYKAIKKKETINLN